MSYSLRHSLSVLTLVPIFLAAGCGGGDEKADAPSGSGSSSSGKDSKSPDSSTGSYEPGNGSTPAQYPCDKVTAAEIGQLLGGTYTFKLGPQDQCDFDSDATASPTAYISIDQFKTDFPTLKGANPGAADVDVAKGGFVADDPTAKVLKNGYAQITDDGVTLQVTLAGGEQADRDAKIEELLKLAVSKL